MLESYIFSFSKTSKTINSKLTTRGGTPPPFFNLKKHPPGFNTSQDWILAPNSALERYGSQHLRTPKIFEIGQGVAKLEHKT